MNDKCSESERSEHREQQNETMVRRPECSYCSGTEAEVQQVNGVAQTAG